MHSVARAVLPLREELLAHVCHSRQSLSGVEHILGACKVMQYCREPRPKARENTKSMQYIVTGAVLLLRKNMQPGLY